MIKNYLYIYIIIIITSIIAFVNLLCVFVKM